MLYFVLQDLCETYEEKHSYNYALRLHIKLPAPLDIVLSTFFNRNPQLQVVEK